MLKSSRNITAASRGIQSDSHLIAHNKSLSSQRDANGTASMLDGEQISVGYLGDRIKLHAGQNRKIFVDGSQTKNLALCISLTALNFA